MDKRRNKKKHKTKVVITALMLVLAMGLLVGCSSSSEAVSKEFKIAEVTTSDMQLQIKGSGAVAATDIHSYYAPIKIEVDEVFVENGERVIVGDVIASVDESSIQDAIDEIKLNIQEVDDNITSVKKTYGTDKVNAPLKGRVKWIYIDEGDSVEAVMDGFHALMILSADDQMLVKVKVEDASAYQVGDSVIAMVDEDSKQFPISKIDIYENTIAFVIEDDEYEIGQTIDVMSINGGSYLVGYMEVNVPIYVSGTIGIVDSVEVEINDEVSKGDVLFKLESDILNNEILSLSQQKENLLEELDDLEEMLIGIGVGEEYQIQAMKNGVVNGLKISENMIVQADTKMFEIVGDEQLEMIVEIDEIKIAKVEVGQLAEVKFEAISGKVYPAVVTHINPLGYEINGITSYDVEILLQETDEILIGMSGNVSIVSDTKTNILTIPIEAVQQISNEYYVILGQDAQDKKIADHKIEVGMSDGTMIEVVSGLSEGDTVSVPNRSTEAAAGPGFGPGADR